MPTLYNNDKLIEFTTLDTYPISSNLTGAISNAVNSNAVFGVGTLFTTETDIDHLGLGFLWNGSDEYRKITAVDSDTLLYIDKPFTVALVAATCRWIPAVRAASVGYSNVSGTAGSKINNITLAAGEGGSFDTNDKNHAFFPIDPIIIDASGGKTVHITVSY